MDGVLIDSEPLWRRAEIETFATVGLELADEDCLETTGLRIDEAVGYWFARSPWTSREPAEMARAIVDRVGELIREEGTPLPGVHTSIEAARERGWRLGLASSSPRILIETVLENFDLREAFETACSAEDEEQGKPHPAVYLSAATHLGIDPRACIAIEDSLNGVRSALAAQMRCIAVLPDETRTDSRFDIAHVRLDDLHELPEALEELGVTEVAT